MDSITQKQCRDCREVKPLSDFGKKSDAKDGIHYYCKKCVNVRGEMYRKSHAEELSKKSSQYYRQRNKGDRYKVSRRKANSKYYNKNIVAQRERASRNNNIRREKLKEYYHQHKGAAEYKLKRAVMSQRRRARTVATVNDFTAEQWREILDKYEHKCLCCGAKRNLSMDHIIPLSRGGQHTASNIQPLCRSCNARKYTNSIDYRPGGY